ncbi:putative patronin isoform X5 [Apostichopus japonicus]|uniref:Putative patronin isoform X5 n=2 Tax=Stichopus japonicus TaxID=307972 RepID=A0A2G8LLQ8_STIJA|nr:putative patronin isoform X5 [Apostichopus japonicus]
MQRRRSNTLPESLKSDDSDGLAKTSGSSIPSDTIAREQSVVSQESNGSGGGGTPEYTGPKLYVKPTGRSNKNLICNAISHCVLAGVPNSPQRDKVLEEVNKSDHKHFMILFRDQGLQFRAVYGYNPDTDEVAKVYGTGPRHITNKMLECMYKYDSGSKKFSKIHSKTLSVQVDALVIGQVYWQSKKSTTTKR